MEAFSIKMTVPIGKSIFSTFYRDVEHSSSQLETFE